MSSPAMNTHQGPLTPQTVSIVRLPCPGKCGRDLRRYSLFWYCLEDEVLIHDYKLRQELSRGQSETKVRQSAGRS